MKEDFLHYIWRYGLYASSTIYTVQKERIYIVKPGQYNTNAGPDFLQSELVINNQKWVGNVEIHINASDWYHHRHEEDSNYDAIILHVVWNHDVDIYMKDNRPLPTLELSSFVSKALLLKYTMLYKSDSRWIPCENHIQKTPSFVLKNWLERLYFERLEQKLDTINGLLNRSKNDWEAVFFQMLARGFGSRVNGDAMLMMAQSMEMSIVRKQVHDPFKLAALLFGQGGLLEDELEDDFYVKLKEEYRYLCHKYKLRGIDKGRLQFFRMRPHNFPTIRIAQLVSLYAGNGYLFSLILKAETIEDYYNLFNVNVDSYWKCHFTFGKKSAFSAKKITKSFIDLLVINTILPIKYHYFKSLGKLNVEAMITLISSIRPEKNRILTKFSELTIQPENALESQGLLQLKNNYCASKRCLECAIGKITLAKR
ncbi:DUF2851 family protein [Flavobacteriaceae bacterium S356]|uniref:DUF2851 family protein n=1 Tax=Asprobacillus argus TaxID=3076534 RepID=A0ABU3LI12_9FLAO|nr:DUF2851 family protein [Flavobacteriaceae bacterium S356]